MWPSGYEGGSEEPREIHLGHKKLGTMSIHVSVSLSNLGHIVDSHQKGGTDGEGREQQQQQHYSDSAWPELRDLCLVWHLRGLKSWWGQRLEREGSLDIIGEGTDNH